MYEPLQPADDGTGSEGPPDHMKLDAKVPLIQQAVADSCVAKAEGTSARRASFMLMLDSSQAELRRVDVDEGGHEAKGKEAMHYLSRFVIIPDASCWWLMFWDLFNMLILLAMAVYEPFSVGLLHEEPTFFKFVSPLCDSTFTADICIQFLTAQPMPENSPGKALWEKNPAALARLYCGVPFSNGGRGGWFWLDFVTVLPMWLPVLDLTPWMAGTGKHLVFLRIFRLVRLLRLARLSNIVANLHIRYGFPFYMVECAKFFAITTYTCHLLACVWCAVEGRTTFGMLNLRPDKDTWLSALISAKGDTCEPDANHDPGCIYMLALYWAVMTLTSVGYGDITPQNKLEYVTSTFSMLVIAFVWAYIVGSIVSILSSFDPQEVVFKQNVDALNELMKSRCLPRELQIRVRTYMHASRRVRRHGNQAELLESSVSRGLQREFVSHSAEVTCILKEVYWTSDLADEALLEIVRALNAACFGQYEVIDVREAMLIMRKGLACVKGRFLQRGDVWGQADILLETRELCETTMPRTWSYVEVLLLTKRSLQEVCRCYPQADRRIRRAQIRTAFFRAFLHAAEQKKRYRRLGTRPSIRQRAIGARGSFGHAGAAHQWRQSRNQDERTELEELKDMVETSLQRQSDLAEEVQVANGMLERMVEVMKQMEQKQQEAAEKGQASVSTLRSIADSPRGMKWLRGRSTVEQSHAAGRSLSAPRPADG